MLFFTVTKLGCGFEARIDGRGKVSKFVPDRRHELPNRMTLDDTGFVTVT
jgi:hypothetical protein